MPRRPLCASTQTTTAITRHQHAIHPNPSTPRTQHSSKQHTIKRI